MIGEAESRDPTDEPGETPRLGVPVPSPQFRRRAWLEFQRAIDPLAPPRAVPAPAKRDRPQR